MASINRLNRAGIRRLIALTPEGRRMSQRDRLLYPEIAGPLPASELEQRFASYLLDPAMRPLELRAGEADWFERCLFVDVIAPGSAISIGDDIAAIVAAPRFVDGDQLASQVMRRRFAPRADLAIAAGIALLSPEAAAREIRRLVAERGPDEDRLHLALLQAGRALAWRAELPDGTSDILEAMLQLLDRATARPIMDAVAPILGALATTSAREGICERVLSTLETAKNRITARRTGTSFLGEFQALDRPRTLRDEDYYETLPDRQLLETCARILGRSAEVVAVDEFVALQSQVLEGELETMLLPAFVDGLIEAGAVVQVGQLVGHLLTLSDIEPRTVALDIAARLPVDEVAQPILACLEDRRTQIRERAIGAAMMLDPEVAVPAVAARIDDPEPFICAAAARALVALGQRDVVEERGMPGEVAIGMTKERTAAIRAALGDTSGDVMAVLLPLAAADAEREGADEEPRLVAALASILRGSAEGILFAAAIIRELPDALPLVALALVGDQNAVSVRLPAELRGELASVLDPFIEAGGDNAIVALQILSRFSLGDPAVMERIIDVADRDEGYAGQLLDCLVQVRRRSERTAALLRLLVEDREHLPGALTAVAAAGLVLPAEHALWSNIQDLYGLGTIATAVVHTALVNRRRVRWED